MPLKEKLHQIDLEIASGDLGKARDRLHGLIATYPDNLDLRKKLGEVYWQLQEPAMAGRYWYLHVDDSPDMELARKRFEKSCGGDALVMLTSLKYRGNLEELEDGHAKAQLETLRQQVQQSHGVTVDFSRLEKPYIKPTKDSERTGKIILWGCVILTLILACITVLGIASIIWWLFS